MYVSTQYLSRNLQCTYEDKKECIDTINQILELADIIRRGFYKDLEKAVKKDNKYSPLLKKGISLIVDRTLDDKEIKKIMYTYIASGNYKGKEFLKNIIISEGIICLNSTMNGYYRVISDIMYSYLGTEFYINNIVSSSTIQPVIAPCISENTNTNLAPITFLSQSEIEELLKKGAAENGY